MAFCALKLGVWGAGARGIAGASTRRRVRCSDDASPAVARRAAPVANVCSSEPGTVEYVKQMRERLGDYGKSFSDENDELWSDMQEEALLASSDEPLLASYLFATILNQKSLRDALAFHLANKLSGPWMPNTLLIELIREAFMDSKVNLAMRLDLLAIMERDPACTRFIDAMLYYKGFHALQAYRVSHALWMQDRWPLAYFLQSQISKELQVDIHPAARIGYGAFMDHATGVVIGETAVLGNNVSMLHQVTLGGSGKQHGDRHPKIANGVLIGSGATVLGCVRVGEGAIVGAGSLVIEDVRAHVTVVGVPARVVGKPKGSVPSKEMDTALLNGRRDAANGNGSEKPELTGLPENESDLRRAEAVKYNGIAEDSFNDKK